MAINNKTDLKIVKQALFACNPLIRVYKYAFIFFAVIGLPWQKIYYPLLIILS